MRENRWTVDQIRCLDCGATFEIDSKHVERDVPRPVDRAPLTRFVMVALPPVCPQCHNLRPVASSADNPDPSTPS